MRPIPFQTFPPWGSPSRPFLPAIPGTQSSPPPPHSPFPKSRSSSSSSQDQPCSGQNRQGNGEGVLGASLFQHWGRVSSHCLCSFRAEAETEAKDGGTGQRLYKSPRSNPSPWASQSPAFRDLQSLWLPALVCPIPGQKGDSFLGLSQGSCGGGANDQGGCTPMCVGGSHKSWGPLRTSELPSPDPWRCSPPPRPPPPPLTSQPPCWAW